MVINILEIKTDCVKNNANIRAEIPVILIGETVDSRLVTRWLIDWLITFKDMTARLGLFYSKGSGDCSSYVHTYMFWVIVSLIYFYTVMWY